jgi:peptidoglycan hydrolase-like protein with peptidoglycan-binding domain
MNDGLNDDGSDVVMYSFPPQLNGSGEHVRKMQEMLIKLGYNVGATGADGKFGKNTGEALQNFQRANGLQPANIAGRTAWILMARQSGMNLKSSTPATITQAPQLPTQVTAPQLPAQVQPVATQAAQTHQQQQPQGGGFDPLKTVNDVAKTVQQYAPAAQQLFQSGQQIFGGQTQGGQPQGGSVMNNPGATPTTVAQPNAQGGAQAGVQAGAQAGGQPNNGQKTAMQRASGEPEYTYVVTEAPVKTLARYGAPVVLGVAAGIGTFKLMDKPSTIISLVVGTATTVVTFIAGNILFPQIETPLTEEQIAALEASSEARRNAGQM